MDHGYRSLIAAIAQQAIDDINGANRFTLKRLLEDDALVAAANADPEGKVIPRNRTLERARRRMTRWNQFQVESAVHYFESSLWHSSADVLGIDSESLPAGLAYQIQQVSYRAKRLAEQRRERARGEVRA